MMLGLQYLYEAGYDPSAAVDMFERMEALERKSPGAFGQLLKHPSRDRGSHRKDAEEHRTTCSRRRREYVVNTSEYEEIRKRWLAKEKQKERIARHEAAARTRNQRRTNSGSHP